MQKATFSVLCYFQLIPSQSSICSLFSLVCPDRLEGRKKLLDLAIYPWGKKKKEGLLLCKGKVFKGN